MTTTSSIAPRFHVSGQRVAFFDDSDAAAPGMVTGILLERLDPATGIDGWRVVLPDGTDRWVPTSAMEAHGEPERHDAESTARWEALVEARESYRYDLEEEGVAPYLAEREAWRIFDAAIECGVTFDEARRELDDDPGYAVGPS